MAQVGALTSDAVCEVIAPVRTTLDLDDDVLQAVKDLAGLHGVTAGKMLSDLARQGLAPRGSAPKVRNGVPLSDIYRLGLAKEMGGRLATFDRSIPLAAVRGATRSTSP